MSIGRITFIVHLPGRPERRAELESSVRAVLHAMSAEPDFVHCALHRAQDDPDTLVVYETWRCSRAHFLAEHLGRDYRAPFEDALADLLAGPRRLEFLDDVDPPLTLARPDA